jgi:hypothetical protein
MSMDVTCVYCGHRGPYPGKLRERGVGGVGFVCASAKDCDERDAKRHQGRLDALRVLKRAGEELTEAEAQELADG